MSKTVRRVWLTSITLLLCALGSCEIGRQKWEEELQELEKQMEDGGFYMSHNYPDTNGWQIAGGVLFLLSMTIAISALMLWRQESKERSR